LHFPSPYLGKISLYPIDFVKMSLEFRDDFRIFRIEKLNPETFEFVPA